MIIKVTSDERYLVNDVETPKARLEGYLRDMNLEGKLVVVQADESLTHGVVVAVLDTAKLAGAEKLAIATTPIPRKAAKK